MTSKLYMEVNGMITEAQAQDLLKVSRTTLWTWRKTGKIKAVKYGVKHYRYPLDEINRVMKEGV